MPQGPHDEWLEPSAGQQEDARRPHVPVHCDRRRAARQHYCLHTRILPQPVNTITVI